MAGQKRKCSYFIQTGACRYGMKCKFSHDIGSVFTPESRQGVQAQVCRSFSATGNCSFEKSNPGKKCRYLHTGAIPSAANSTRQTAPQQSKRRGWSSDLSSATSMSPTRLATYIQDALNMIESDDPAVKQDLINDLGSEKGLEWISWILESSFVLHDSDYDLGFFRHCVPFLALISHEEVLSSLVLEKAVGSIYNVVYGSFGQRGARFFRNAIGSIETAVSEAGQSPDLKAQIGKALCVVSAGLFHTINLNQEAIVQEDFKSLGTALNCCLCNYDVKDSYFARSAMMNLVKIKDRLHLGGLIPNRTINRRAPATNFPQFTLQVDLPGELSAQGRRHQNDHASIELISILPTTDEIKSTRQDFLPIRGANHHEEGIRRLLDSQFRLLREDNTGQLRDALSAIMNQWNTIVGGSEKASRAVLRQISPDISIFEDIIIQAVRFDQRKGMVVDVAFNQPHKVSEMGHRQRMNWWKDISKDLQFGSLVALVDGMRATFLTVADREIDTHQPASDHYDGVPISESPRAVVDLASNPTRAMISLQLARSTCPSDQTHIFSLLRSPESMAVLTEFRGVLFQSFEPILGRLKQLHKSPNIPFTRWLGPPAGSQFESQDGITVDVPPPLYMTKGEGITLDLSCITNDSHQLTHSIRMPVTVDRLQTHTSLDAGQCQSLVLALQTEFALIQGPPGTGKSYVGLQIARILLQNWIKIQSGPIICVCYTNHALDQFLEHVMNAGETNIIRLGSRSKSEALQERTLNVIGKGAERTKIEKHDIWSLNSQIQLLGSELEILFNAVSRPIGCSDISEYLHKNMSQLHQDLFGAATEGPVIDSEGFQRVQRAYTESDLHKVWLRGSCRPGAQGQGQLPTTNRGLQYLRTCRDIWLLSQLERERISTFWKEEIRDNREAKLKDLLSQFSGLRYDLKRRYGETDRRCLEEARVIGVTTTGLASHSEVLRKLRSKILIVEEAAEVLEAHTITAILPSVEHVIMIGDHFQLRAKVNKYELSTESEQGKKYRLDESLFERLTQDCFGSYRMPFAQLDTQRRMHPSIASLVRDTLYPQLHDHENTYSRPEVVGMKKRLQWLDHHNHEDSVTDLNHSSSKSNEWEAELVVALVRHISRQGEYTKDDITVLTPYLGQLRKLRRKFEDICEMVAVGERDLEEIAQAEETEEAEEQPIKAQKGRMIEGCRISTVDNFQGEEARVIIVSLVRSNPDRRVGFLRTSNRINVLLSRARDGMFIVGDAETAGSIPMWSDVISILGRDNNIGKHLQLQCPRHSNTKIAVSTPNDFNRLAPEGGCSEQCFKRLACGHTCIMKCHSDMLHDAVQCYEDCMRQFERCDHLCPKRCYEKCGLCRTRITSNITLPCGHTPQSLECHETHNLEAIECKEMVLRGLSRCNHIARMSCHMDVEKYKCRQPCGGLLPCSHKCLRPCSECRKPGEDDKSLTLVLHKVCTTPCGRPFTTCNHRCQKPCHGDRECGACEAPCDVQCSHSLCPKKCSEPCVPCAENCASSCSHRGQCNMPCAVPCNRLPCNKRCERLLSCGHRCLGICGESCPDPASGCQQCAAPNIQGRIVDLVAMSTFADASADADHDPFIFLTCGHIYTASTLDGHMAMRDIYVLDPFGNPLEPQPLTKVAGKTCPECRFPLRNINRYNRVVKTALIDETTKRFMTYSAGELEKLTGQIAEAALKLENAVITFIEKKQSGGLVSETAQLTRFKSEAVRNISKVNKFIISVTEAEQPYGRVKSMVVNARRRGHADAKFDVANSEIQHGFSLRGRNLKIHFVFAFLWNLNTLLSSVASEISDHQWTNFMVGEIKSALADCVQLRKDANDAKQLPLEIDARIRGALFRALGLRYSPKRKVPDENEPEETRNAAAQRVEEDNRSRAESRAAAAEELEQCLDMLTPSTENLRKDIEQAQLLLNGGTFYQSVSLAEMREVYAAMARGFSGTGHWYYCENNHPFTVGECGMPMELTRCPECGASVGGQHHVAVGGVRRAEDLERDMARMTV